MVKSEQFAAAQFPPPLEGTGEAAGKALYGLVGFPLGHSFSRGFFTEKFRREGTNAEYVNFEIPDASMLLDVIRQHPNLRGLNVTLPHKQAVIPFLDAMSDEAREIGAVNVIRICDGRLTGFNSDIIGFTESIRPLLQPWHRKALVLGTGGASRAICVGLKRLGLEWTYVSRKATLPLGEGRGEAFNYADLTADVMQEYTVIVNCTPVGMFPKVDAAPAIPYEHLTPRHLLFDCVYNPEDTLFLKRGREQGATGKNGLEMLHLQALASWRFWNGL